MIGFEKNNKGEIMQVTFKVKNITPICQIEGNREERIEHLNMQLNTITIKTITKLFNGYPVDIPIYTANGLRGLYRRVCGELLIEEYLNKGNNIKAEDFHLMMAGGGSNYQSQSLEIEEKVKELNPVISVFGTSLAIEGKLIVTHLEPEDALIKVIEKDDTSFAISQIVKRMIFIKKDDILQKTKFGRFLTREDVIAWENIVTKSQEKRKEERKKDIELIQEKTKKEAIQSILAKNYIIPNVTFKGFLSTKFDLTEIEEGMLIKGFEKLVHQMLGSSANLGFGICDWDITLNDTGSKIIAKSKDENIFEKELDLLLSDEDKKKVDAFEKWLKDIKQENIEISKILKTK